MTKSKTPAKPKLPKADYETLKTELDELMLELQREDLPVDTALSHYQRGLELVKQLENYLQTTEATIQTLQAKFKTG